MFHPVILKFSTPLPILPYHHTRCIPRISVRSSCKDSSSVGSQPFILDLLDRFIHHSRVSHLHSPNSAHPHPELIRILFCTNPRNLLLAFLCEKSLQTQVGLLFWCNWSDRCTRLGSASTRKATDDNQIASPSTPVNMYSDHWTTPPTHRLLLTEAGRV